MPTCIECTKLTLIADFRRYRSSRAVYLAILLPTLPYLFIVEAFKNGSGSGNSNNHNLWYERVTPTL